MATEAGDESKSTPLGIKIYCLLMIIPASVFIAAGFVQAGAFVGESPLGGVAILALGFLQLALVYGLWTLKPWGWGFSIVNHGLGALWGGVQVLQGKGIEPGAGAAIALGLLVYIYSKHEYYVS